jgi:hypothetical protein
MKIIKCILLAFIVAAVAVIGLIKTQDLLFWPIINLFMKIRGHYPLEGEELGTETSSILLKIIIPITYALSFVIIYKWLSRSHK